MKIRVGMGFDVHQLEDGKDFWLGGIQLPASKGAVGHSDADVLIHALCDALLGAASLGDIGQHFQNTDPRWKGMSSKFFLEEVVKMLKERNWSIENVDCTLSLEKPKLSPHIPAMKEILSGIMNIDKDAVSIKATTNERLGD
ncbi:MAG TPA: 2-C-methyl-D-erythritol 2,4-cyclodiphosphate synthase, partial [Cyclobacteriaceae bacterium]|nr:2-C-methyl-D-erythritol 2,4-cyclodiphosphate synthase [Cyclobacteriaceae bacterium]